MRKDARAFSKFPHYQLGINHKPLRAKAAEGAAPSWVRRVEPHNNAAGHRYNANDLTTGLRLPATQTRRPIKRISRVV